MISDENIIFETCVLISEFEPLKIKVSTEEINCKMIDII